MFLSHVRNFSDDTEVLSLGRLLVKRTMIGLCIRLGRGHWDARGGKWGHQAWDAGTSNIGAVGSLMLLKSKVNAKSIACTTTPRRIQLL